MKHIKITFLLATIQFLLTFSPLLAQDTLFFSQYIFPYTIGENLDAYVLTDDSFFAISQKKAYPYPKVDIYPKAIKSINDSIFLILCGDVDYLTIAYIYRPLEKDIQEVSMIYSEDGTNFEYYDDISVMGNGQIVGKRIAINNSTFESISEYYLLDVLNSNYSSTKSFDLI